jgi:hypothetical protein
MGTIGADLLDEVLASQSLQDRHHGGVGQVTLEAERFVHLAHGLGLGSGPELFHDGPFQFTQRIKPGQSPFTSG